MSDPYRRASASARVTQPTSSPKRPLGGVPTRDAVDDLYREMVSAGYRGLQEPWDAFWGARYAVIEDPDGIGVGLMSPVSSDMKSPTPEV
jgi:uncharacterized glyoxalase superfamily protein PhnB